MGMYLTHVLLDGAHVFSVIDADALGLEMVVHAALVHVVERQETEHAAVGCHGVDLLVGEEVGAHVAVRQHHALGVACSARRVDECRPVVRLNRLLNLLYHWGILLPAGNTRLEDFEHTVLAFDAGQGEDGRRILHLGKRGSDTVEQHDVADKDIARLAMVEDLIVIVGTERWIHRHMHDACHGQRHVDEVPFGAVGRHGDDSVATF